VTLASEDAINATFNVSFFYAPNPATPGATIQDTGTLIFDKVAGLFSHGNYVGPGNKILDRNKEYVAQQKALNPDYNVTLIDEGPVPPGGFNPLQTRPAWGHQNPLSLSSGVFQFDNMTAALQPNGQPVPNTGNNFAAFELGAVRQVNFTAYSRYLSATRASCCSSKATC
jgi:hypothetical protein